MMPRRRCQLGCVHARTTRLQLATAHAPVPPLATPYHPAPPVTMPRRTLPPHRCARRCVWAPPPGPRRRRRRRRLHPRWQRRRRARPGVSRPSPSRPRPRRPAGMGTLVRLVLHTAVVGARRAPMRERLAPVRSMAAPPRPQRAQQPPRPPRPPRRACRGRLRPSAALRSVATRWRAGPTAHAPQPIARRARRAGRRPCGSWRRRRPASRHSRRGYYCAHQGVSRLGKVTGCGSAA